MTLAELNRRMAELDGWQPRRRWRVFYDKERQHASIDIYSREEALARKADTEGFWKDCGFTPADFSEPEEYDEWDHVPSYITSLDAIRPVLEKMTDEELWWVAKQISRCNSVSLLRVTPEQLCRAIVATKGQQ